jgi:hypothetical protein
MDLKYLFIFVALWGGYTIRKLQDKVTELEHRLRMLENDTD